MSTDLTPGQHALLEAALMQQQNALEQALHQQLGGQDRVSHALAAQEGSPRQEPSQDAEREVDLARSDTSLQALRAVNSALQRLREPGYGRCVDCERAIPFDRLRLHPEVLRCVDCQAQQEQRGPVQHHPTM